MQKVLRKRVFRNLKKHFVRYFMLGLMVAMGIFLVVTIVGSGETLTQGTIRLSEITNLEDGEFELFVPLSDKETDDIKKMGIDIEKQFFYDYQMEDNSFGTVRIFKVRENINQLYIISGSIPVEKNEIFLEKRYAEDHKLNVGDSFEMAGVTYKIAGIGVVSDYDAPLKELSDASCNSKFFGPVFITKEAYELFSKSGNAQKSENYHYAYKLSQGADEDGLKRYLKNLKIDADQIDDELFHEYWDRTGGVADELRDAVKQLSDATNDVKDGLNELSSNNSDINDASQKIFDTYLEQASAALAGYGMSVKLTEEDYSDQLGSMIKGIDNPVMKSALQEVKDNLDSMKAYKDGIGDYTGGVEELDSGLTEMSDGVNKLDDAVNEKLDNLDFSISDLTLFLKRADDPRIFATKSDKLVDIEVGLIAGIILLILFSYVISVFVVHSIEKESSIIGTLYSMGVTKNDLLLHYITLPVVVTLIAGVVGLLLASAGIMAPMIAESSYSYFSIPKFDFTVPDYLLIYSVVCPPVIAAIVNVLIINSKLNRTALSLIRNEVKQSRTCRINLGKLEFVKAFRIRQMIREMRSTLAVVFGMFLALLIFMMAVNCYSLCTNFATDYANDIKFEYMYTLKYPEKEVPKDAEAAYAYSCKKSTLGFKFDVTILGIEKDSKFFDVQTADSRVNVVVSSAFAEKFALKEGDEFVVADDEKDMKYAFSVKKITTYSAGFYVFMDIDNMREMMGESDDYYNVLFSDKALDINPGRLYSTTTREDIVKGTSVFTSLMMPMIYTLSFSSALIFCVVMYLMMKVMIDRSAQNISLIKVFGYRRKEIRKLYLDGNFYIIAIGALIVVPLSKLIMNKLFPFMVSNVACGLNLTTPMYFYFIVYVVIILLYFLINAILVKRLDKFAPAEILKNRE